MDERVRVALVVAGTVGLFLAVQLGALALAEPFDAAGYRAVEDPQDPTNSLVYVGVILVATAGMLLAIRFGVGSLVRAIIVLTGGLLSWYVFGVLFGKLLGPVLSPATVGLATLLAAGAVVAGLLVHPEWYVIDAAGVVMGAGAAGLFGISFGLLPALVLLVVLAVYDAISVYGTEHMLTLAEGVMDLKVPVLLVVPATLSFSLRDLAAEDGLPGGTEAATDPASGAGADPDGAQREADAGAGPLQRDALFIGLGDAVVPTVLVASAGFFLDAPSLVAGLALNLPALGAVLGTLAGLGGLLYLVLQGRAHAGLPLLNGGAISGYLAGALAAGVPLTAALGL